MKKRIAAVVQVERSLLDKMAKLIAQRDQARADARVLLRALVGTCTDCQHSVTDEIARRVAAYPAGHPRTVDTSEMEAVPRKLQRQRLRRVARRGGR